MAGMLNSDAIDAFDLYDAARQYHEVSEDEGPRNHFFGSLRPLIGGLFRKPSELDHKAKSARSACSVS